MDILEQEQRKMVVEEAISFVGTPYHHGALVKGVGADCGRLIEGVFVNCGLIPKLNIGHYPQQWFLHRSEEKYLAIVEEYTHRIEGPPQPADLVIYKYGRCFAHGGIVIEWPMIIHSYIPDKGCVWGNASMGELSKRQHLFYSYWSK